MDCKNERICEKCGGTVRCEGSKWTSSYYLFFAYDSEMVDIWKCDKCGDEFNVRMENEETEEDSL